MARHLVYLAALLVTGVCAALTFTDTRWAWGLTLALPLALLGTWDIAQRQHALMRNYPLIGRLRWLFESIRPQIQQYFVNDDLNGTPFNRVQRSIVYARAKGDDDFAPFGTKGDVYAAGFEWVEHAIMPKDLCEAPRVRVGSSQCVQPYAASLLNISAMSFGALGANAIRALNLGAREGGFAHDTGEGGISPHHRQGGDLIWELGTGYFGCRAGDGGFDPVEFAKRSTDVHVRMIEIKLSQGAKPGHGGILPGAKVTAEIAATRGVPVGRDCISPARHRAFSTPLEMLDFVKQLRELSGGKPVGIKLCIGHPWEFLGICRAMVETKTHVDFVVVDGKEGGTGAAPEEFSNSVGMPLREGLLFVRNALVGLGLKDQVRIAASAKVVTGFDMLRNLALGADWCNAARPFMFALGCLQSRRCHLGTCPTGVATQDPLRQRGLDVEDKARRVARYHAQTLKHLMELVAAAGLEAPSALRPEHVHRRLDTMGTRTFANTYSFLEPGELLEGSRNPWYADHWRRATAEAF
ncbi:MAG TPA: FMN-binding glutamate synthase family protein [Gammaproteobacteria bacterium]|nr:FMN-binding glutamate synthase family protein [Gammaproteobacteria bacterium]